MRVKIDEIMGEFSSSSSSSRGGAMLDEEEGGVDLREPVHQFALFSSSKKEL
jgi:hypothetical protein